MKHQITKKITSFKVITNDDIKVQEPIYESMNVNIPRPEELPGSTYKIKPPQEEHAIYITINDIILNPGTEHEKRVPYEIFINSKNMTNFQWVLAMTRLISAIFRNGGDPTFMIAEMKAVFDPKGGYFKKGGVFMPSIVAEIAHEIERHMIKIGMVKREGLDEHQQQLVDSKRKEFEDRHGDATLDDGFPEKAVQCPKCNTRAMVLLDNCMTCLECGNSKCN